jgi:hypothetical protein
VVEKISGSSEIPLGKILLRAVYSLLNIVSQHLMQNETIPTIIGPWWLLLLWLNLHLHKLVALELMNLSFPSLEYLEDQEEQLPRSEKFHRCMSFGEAASVITIDRSTTDFFKLFYRNSPEAALEWFVYSNIPKFELPASFRFQTIYSDPEEFKILSHQVRPNLLPVEVTHRREKPPTSYEFFCPLIVAKQMGFGKLPPALFFADKVKPRETVNTGIEYNIILHFEQSLLPEAISGWECTRFTSIAFDHWWQEWSHHIFNEPISVYTPP